MKKINFRKTLFAAVLLFQLNAIAAFGQTVRILKQPTRKETMF